MKKFKNALNGMIFALVKDKSILLQCGIGFVTILLFFGIGISLNDFILVLLCIGLVVSLEIINSSIELLCNFVSPQYHHQIKRIKDLSSAAVLFASAISLSVGLILLIKYGGII